MRPRSGRALRQVISHETVQAWTWDVWSRLRVALEADARAPRRAHHRALIEGAVRNLGEMVANDAGTRARACNARPSGWLRGCCPPRRPRSASFIASVVGNWDTATITERIELRVGRDLQYVRMNGTLVGFLAGGGPVCVARCRPLERCRF